MRPKKILLEVYAKSNRKSAIFNLLWDFRVFLAISRLRTLMNSSYSFHLIMLVMRLPLAQVLPGDECPDRDSVRGEMFENAWWQETCWKTNKISDWPCKIKWVTHTVLAEAHVLTRFHFITTGRISEPKVSAVINHTYSYAYHKGNAHSKGHQWQQTVRPPGWMSAS